VSQTFRIEMPDALAAWVKHQAEAVGKPIDTLVNGAVAYFLGALDADTGHHVVPHYERVLINDDGEALAVTDMTPTERKETAEGIRKFARGLDAFAAYVDGT